MTKKITLQNIIIIIIALLIIGILTAWLVTTIKGDFEPNKEIKTTNIFIKIFLIIIIVSIMAIISYYFMFSKKNNEIKETPELTVTKALKLIEKGICLMKKTEEGFEFTIDNIGNIKVDKKILDVWTGEQEVYPSHDTTVLMKEIKIKGRLWTVVFPLNIDPEKLLEGKYKMRHTNILDYEASYEKIKKHPVTTSSEAKTRLIERLSNQDPDSTTGALAQETAQKLLREQINETPNQTIEEPYNIYTSKKRTRYGRRPYKSYQKNNYYAEGEEIE